MYLNAYGLFNDIWAPITEACLNIGLSILFGYFWGLNGILAGVLASLFIIHSCWKPYFLFSKGLHVPIITYIQIYARHILAAAIATGLTLWIFSFIHFPRNGHFSGFCCVLQLPPRYIFASIDRTFLFHRWYARFCCQNSKNNKLI